jgi:L-serine dehydratase
MKGPTKNDDNLFPSLPDTPSLPSNIDRRSFLMRNAAIGAAAVMTGSMWSPEARAQQATKEAAAAPPLGARCPLTSTSSGNRRAR